MNSASDCKPRGNILVFCLVLISIMSTASLAGFARTASQSQLAAALTRQALLQAADRQTLVEAARRVDAAGKKYARLQAPGCPERCDWHEAWPVDAGKNIDAAFIAQRLAPEINHYMLIARATHEAGGESISYGLFNADTHRFYFVR